MTKFVFFDARPSLSAADGTIWIRAVTMLAGDLQYPIIYVRDRFLGAVSGVEKVLTWNLMAQGAVETPVGPYKPIEYKRID